MINPIQGQGYSPTMTQIDDGANSSYNGLLAVIQHRMSNNFSFLANYTWSHCISIGDSPGDIAGPTFQDSANRRLDRSNCGFDVRHIFNTTFVASSHFTSLQGWTGALANNWQLAPIIRLTSGLPLNVTSGIDNSLTGIGLDRPNLINPQAVYTGRKITAEGGRKPRLSEQSSLRPERHRYVRQSWPQCLPHPEPHQCGRRTQPQLPHPRAPGLYHPP